MGTSLNFSKNKEQELIAKNILKRYSIKFLPKLFRNHTLRKEGKVWAKKKQKKPTTTGHVQKLAINKKSTFFVGSSWNLVKMITSWTDYFHQVS